MCGSYSPLVSGLVRQPPGFRKAHVACIPDFAMLGNTKSKTTGLRNLYCGRYRMHTSDDDAGRFGRGAKALRRQSQPHRPDLHIRRRKLRPITKLHFGYVSPHRQMSAVPLRLANSETSLEMYSLTTLAALAERSPACGLSTAIEWCSRLPTYQYHSLDIILVLWSRVGMILQQNQISMMCLTMTRHLKNVGVFERCISEDQASIVTKNSSL